jgi:hypothetical protein
MNKGRGMKKKKWPRPKLTVLTRGRPEEMALAACKSVSRYVWGAQSVFDSCWNPGAPPYGCSGACNWQALS